jgi:hypothetical protein
MVTLTALYMLVLAVLATYRLAYDFTRMDGPFHLYLHVRSWFIGHYGEGHWLTDGVTCPICLSFWLALLFSLPVLAADNGVLPVVFWPLVWFGVAGGALALVKATTK